MIKCTKDSVTPITLSDLRKIDIDVNVARYIKEINSGLILSHIEGKKNVSIPIYSDESLDILQAKYPDFKLKINWINANMYLCIEWE